MFRVRKIVNAKRVYEKKIFGKDVNIAVLDTGIYKHPDFENRIKYFKDYVSYKDKVYDDNGHGTHVAGILAGNGFASKGKICGMAPMASLYILKILDFNGDGDTRDVVAALDWLIANHEEKNIKLLNFSLGFLPNSKIYEHMVIIERINKLWDNGVAVIASAGNNGPKKKTVTVPGNSRKVITVGALDDRNFNGAKSGYSGKGPTSECVVKPEIFAPGSNVCSTDINGGNYVFKTGTSMATPVVCGALALVLEIAPELKPWDLKMLLYESADSGRLSADSLSWGCLNVDKMIELL